LAVFFIALYQTASADSCKGPLWNSPRITGSEQITPTCRSRRLLLARAPVLDP
jgi:hypothetical protein